MSGKMKATICMLDSCPSWLIKAAREGVAERVRCLLATISWMHVLGEAGYLGPFQSGLRPGYRTETALVAFLYELCQELDKGSVSLLDFSQWLSIPCGILLTIWY